MFKLEPYICHRLLEMFSYSDARRQGICNHIDMLIDAGRFTQSEVEQLTPVISHLKKVCVSEDGTFINNPDKGLLEILKVQDLDGYWYIHCNSLLSCYRNVFSFSTIKQSEVEGA